jgi:hypothetical protein
MSTRRNLLTLAVLLTLAACATGGGTEEQDRGSRNRIVRAELQEIPVTTAFEAVRQLRPNWLRQRGEASISAFGSGGIRVVIDSAPQGELEVLETIRTDQIEEMRFLNQSEASVRYGTNFGYGAIEIVTRKGR